jgi:hypothetical protein
MGKDYSHRRFFDRHLVELAIGDKVRCQYCVGRYGQTRQIEGILESIDPAHRTITVKATDGGPEREFHGNDLCWRGLRMGVFDAYNRPPEFPNDWFVGYYRHNDYEHGYESWVEVLT